MPTVEHVIFIPAVLLVGFVLGYVFGGNAARNQMAARAKRQKE
jgi:hypothetical protein